MGSGASNVKGKQLEDTIYDMEDMLDRNSKSKNLNRKISLSLNKKLTLNNSHDLQEDDRRKSIEFSGKKKKQKRNMQIESQSPFESEKSSLISSEDEKKNDDLDRSSLSYQKKIIPEVLSANLSRKSSIHTESQSQNNEASDEENDFNLELLNMDMGQLINLEFSLATNANWRRDDDRDMFENIQSLSSGVKPGTYRKKMIIATEIPRENEELSDEKKYSAEVLDIRPNTSLEEDGFKVDKQEVTMDDFFKDSGMTAFCRKGNGQESTNQDDYCIYIDPYIKVFMVLDGHGPYGHFISNTGMKLIMKQLLDDPELNNDPLICMKTIFKKLSHQINEYLAKFSMIKNANSKFSGACCTLVIQKDCKLFIAHIGDTRAIIGKKQKNKKFTLQLTTDHVPSSVDEKKRIYENGGEVKKLSQDFIDKIFVRGRLYPGLWVSRAIGDEIASYIGVSNEPEYYVYDINPANDIFLLIGSKSIFTFLDDPEIVSLLQAFSYKSAKMAGEYLFKRVKGAWNQNESYFEDMTTILIYFKEKDF